MIPVRIQFKKKKERKCDEIHWPEAQDFYVGRC